MPVECFYLPLHENWPSPMEGNYNGDYWADRAFPESYRRAFVAAARQIAAHCPGQALDRDALSGLPQQQEQLQGPRLVARVVAVAAGRAGQFPGLLGPPITSPGPFTKGSTRPPEPARKQPASSPRLVFRADISRPQWRRDSLDGLLDYHVVGSAMRNYPRLVFERKRALGEIVLEYGSTNPVEGSNLQPVAWCLDVWSLGADGVIPWQTVGNAESWNQADELSLFYPARSAGPRAGPIPSIRLKAYRRGQQDVEYLTLWSQLRNEPRWAVGQQVRAALKLAGTRQGTGFTGGEDAGRIDYGRLRPRDVWALRVAIGEALSQAHPAPQKQARRLSHTAPRAEAATADVCRWECKSIRSQLSI